MGPLSKRDTPLSKCDMLTEWPNADTKRTLGYYIDRLLH